MLLELWIIGRREGVDVGRLEELGKYKSVGGGGSLSDEVNGSAG